MKIKTIIVLKTRHNEVQFHDKKKLAANKNMFDYGNNTYSCDSGHFIITSNWRFYGVPVKRNYITFYFREGDPKALPFPLFEDMEANGIQGDELNAIFTPKFYQIIARKTPNKKQDIIYYMTMLAAAASSYCAYTLFKMNGG